MHITHTRRTTGWALAALLSLSFFLSFAVPCDGRTWTNHKGQELEGDYAGCENGKVIITRDRDGQDIRVTLDKLCADDQSYVRQQLAAAGDDADVPETGAEELDPEVEGILSIMALGLGVLIVVGIIFSIIMFLIRALFIHLAAKIMNFSGTFGTACLAEILEMVFSLLAGFVTVPLALLLAHADALAAIPVAGLLVSLILYPMGIKVAYSEGFWASLAAWILSLILTLLVGGLLLAMVIFGLTALAGGMG